MEKRLVKIGEAARLLGTDHSALRKWERTGELLPAQKTRTVFSARLYGSRSKKHKKMLETLKDVAGTQD